MTARSAGSARVPGELRQLASWMRLLIRHGSAISGMPALLNKPAEELGASMRISMDAEELANYTDRIARTVTTDAPDRVDIALRLRDLLEVRRPTRKARLAPVDGEIVLEQGEGFSKLSIRVPYLEAPVFPVVLTLDDELVVQSGQRVSAGELMCRGEIHLPDLLQISGTKAVLKAFRLHLVQISKYLGEPKPPELPQAMAFVRNWMLGWARVMEPAGLPVRAGEILPMVKVRSLIEELGPQDTQPLIYRHLASLPSLAERYLGGLSPEGW